MSHVKWLLGENIEEVASTLKEVEELVSTVLHVFREERVI